MLDWQTIQDGTILLIDDEEDNLEVVAETLLYKGLKVVTAENGEDALQKLETFTPTLILTDLSMPKMDGWEFRGRVRAKPALARIPIIALSAHAMAGDKERALNAGFDAYMTKPIMVQTLQDDLRKLVDEINQRQPAANQTMPEQGTLAQKPAEEQIKQ